MGVRILSGNIDGSHFTGACFYCSTSMWAFGPIFEDEIEAHAFLEWLPDKPDPRQYSDAEMENLLAEFHEWKVEQEKADMANEPA